MVFVLCKFFFLLLCAFWVPGYLEIKTIDLGVDLFFQDGHALKLKGKRVGLITNHTGVGSDLSPTYERFMQNTEGFSLSAIFSPEHGFQGEIYAEKSCDDIVSFKGVPVFSLYGEHRRPTQKMLENIDVLVYDIQDIGSRSYTYVTTLFYVMEEAAKCGIPVVVLDRPNPMGGEIVDGPMLEKKWASFIGYIDVPYCHGMTVGELARYFNKEYQVGCQLDVVPMRGWRREMLYQETGLAWIPTSPYIPEDDSPLFYATTGIIGSLSIVSIGIGYTLPFKVIGAPWIKSESFAQALNKQKLSGIKFVPFHFRPQFGLFKGQSCEGVLLVITNKHTFKPLTIQYLILGILKSMYPIQMNEGLARLDQLRKDQFCKACGNQEMLDLLIKEKYVAWKLMQYQKQDREMFIEKRKKYLLY